MKLKPLFDRVVITPKKQAEVTAGGLVLPVKEDKSQLATVVAIGDGGLIDGKETQMKLKVGQTVLYSKYAGSEFKLGEQDYIIIKQTDILAVVEE